jgi:serine/threonine protein kinase
VRQRTLDYGPGSEIAGYRIETQIGHGGMSRVYRAHDTRLDRPVALKVLGSHLANDPAFRARFEREWRLAAALRHPHIIPIYDAGDDEGNLYIAMLLVDGGDLSSVLRRHGALEPGRALDLLAQVASALDAAHREQLIHRDLKPSNILLDSGHGADDGDHAYLADFGLTKSIAAPTHLTQTGFYLGTPNYSAPEQVEGRAVDTRADVYALGCVMFECLTGSVPFPRDTEMAAVAAHLTESPPSVLARRPGLPEGLDDVVGKALAKSPGARYGTAPELVRAARAAVRSAEANTVAIAQAATRAPDTPFVPSEPPRAVRPPSPGDARISPGPRGDSAYASENARRSDRPRRPVRKRRQRHPYPLLALLAAILLVPLVVVGALLAGVFRSSRSAPGGTVGALTSSLGPSGQTPSAAASPAVNPYFAGATSDERFLLDAVPVALVADCTRGARLESDTVPANVPTIDCPVDDPAVGTVRYFRFLSSEQLLAWWRTRLITASLQPDSGGCAGGKVGETSYDGGRLLCFVTGGNARLRWLDEARLILGVVNRRNPEIQPVLQWWLDTHAAKGIRAEPRFQPIEQALVDEAPEEVAENCIPYRLVAKGDRPVLGSLGAIDCPVGTSLVEDVGYFELPTLSALDAWWGERIKVLELERDSGGCLDGTPGERRASTGRVACYISGGKARIRWTDEGRLVAGALNGEKSDLGRLYTWWSARH